MFEPGVHQALGLQRSRLFEGPVVLAVASPFDPAQGYELLWELGSQILARGLGGQNHLGVAREFGWCPVEVTDAGRDDPVLGAIPPCFSIFQWHSDTFSLPEGAVHLAQSGVARHQAFRFGRAAYGMQFHFEANRAVVRDWSREFPQLIATLDPDWAALHEMRAEREGAAADLDGLSIARAWVALI